MACCAEAAHPFRRARQRVALGRAVVRRPAVPLRRARWSNLEPSCRTDTRADWKRHPPKAGPTTVYVTHDQEEAMTLGQRIAVLPAGGFSSAATGRWEVYTPRPPLRRRLHRTPAMNSDRSLAAGRRRPDLVRVAMVCECRPRRALAKAGNGTGPICGNGPKGCLAPLGPVPFPAHPGSRVRSASGPTTCNSSPRQADGEPDRSPCPSPARSRPSSRWAARWTCTSRRPMASGSSAAPPLVDPVRPAGEPSRRSGEDSPVCGRWHGRSVSVIVD